MASNIVFTAETQSLISGLKKAQNSLKTMQSQYKLAKSEAELLGNSEDKLTAKLNAAGNVKQQQTKIVEAYEKALDAVNKEIDEHQKKTDELNEKLKEASNATEKDEEKIKELTTALNNQNKVLDNAKAKQEKLTKEYYDAKTAVNQTQAEINDLEQELNDLAQVTEEVEQATEETADNFEDMGSGAEDAAVNVSSAQDAIKALSDMLGGLYDALDSVTNKFEEFVGNGIKKAIDGMKELAEFSFEKGVTFEYAMDQLAATMMIDETNEQYKALSETAKRYGASTKYTATEAAEGLNILAQAGLNAEEQVEGIGDVLNFAIAGSLSLEDSATYLTAAVKGYSDEMKNMSKYADLVALGASKSNTNVNMLGRALSSSSSTAKSYGQTAENLTVSLMRLAEQNITGEEAATALNRAMMDLYTPNSAQLKAQEKLGISIYDAAGNAREFNDILAEVEKKLSKMSEKDANNLKNELFSTYGLQAYNKMTATSVEKVQEFRDALAEANGASQAMADTMSDNMQGAIDSFNSACEGVGIAIYEKLSPGVKTVIDNLTTWIQEQGLNISGDGYFAKAFRDIGDAIQRFAEKVPDMLSRNQGLIRILFDQIGQIVVVLIDSLPYLIEDLLPKLLEFISEMLDGLPEFLEDTLPMLMDGILFFIENLPAILTCLYGLQGLTGLLKVAADVGILIVSFKTLIAGGGAVATALSGLGAAFTAALGPIALIVGAIAAVVAIFVIAYKKSDGFRQVIANLWAFIKDKFIATIDNMKNRFKDLGERFGWLSDDGNLLMDIIVGIADVLAILLAEAILIVIEAVDWCIDMFADLCLIIGGLIDIIVSFFTGDWDGVKKAARDIADGVCGIVTDTFDGIKNLCTGTKDIFTSTMDGMAGKATGTADTVAKQVDRINKSLNSIDKSNVLSSISKAGSSVVSANQSVLDTVQKTPSAVLNTNYVTNNINITSPTASTERSVAKALNDPFVTATYSK